MLARADCRPTVGPAVAGARGTRPHGVRPRGSRCRGTRPGGPARGVAGPGTPRCGPPPHGAAAGAGRCRAAAGRRRGGAGRAGPPRGDAVVHRWVRALRRRRRPPGSASPGGAGRRRPGPGTRRRCIACGRPRGPMGRPRRRCGRRGRGWVGRRTRRRCAVRNQRPVVPVCRADVVCRRARAPSRVRAGARGRPAESPGNPDPARWAPAGDGGCRTDRGWAGPGARRLPAWAPARRRGVGRTRRYVGPTRASDGRRGGVARAADDGTARGRSGGTRRCRAGRRRRCPPSARRRGVGRRPVSRPARRPPRNGRAVPVPPVVRLTRTGRGRCRPGGWAPAVAPRRDRTPTRGHAVAADAACRCRRRNAGRGTGGATRWSARPPRTVRSGLTTGRCSGRSSVEPVATPGRWADSRRE
ncbi:hypothetical protein GUI43_06530 [Micromonospora noduli]|nr:hypothetical protein GUI43_06530 [Micromonospora noduli]